MKIRKLFTALAVSLALIAAPAHAFLPAVWLWLSSGGAQALALHAGIVYPVWRVAVNTAATDATPPMEVVFIQDEAVTPQDVSQAFGKTPASTVPNQRQENTTFSGTFGSLTITGSSQEELMQKMQQAPLANGVPQVPAGFAYYRNELTVKLTSYSYQRDITSGASKLTISTVVSKAGGTSLPGYTCSTTDCTYTAVFTSDKEFVCPQGYAYSTTSTSQCNLVDPVAAKSAPTLRDQVCSVSRQNVPNPFDPDCADLQGKGLLNTGTANGQPTATITDAKTGQGVSGYTNGDGSKGMSRSTPTTGGGNYQEHVKVDDKGKVSDPSSNNQPSPTPAPTNPYTPGGTCDKNMGPIPSWCGQGIDSGGGGCTSNCNNTTNNNGGTGTGGSGTGLTEGNVKNGVRDGVGEALKTGEGKSIGEQDGDINADTPDATDGIFGKFLAFKTFSVTDPGYNCATALNLGSAGATTLNFTMFGNQSISADMNLNKVCPLIEPHESEIQAITLALWTISAILMFIRLTV